MPVKSSRVKVDWHARGCMLGKSKEENLKTNKNMDQIYQGGAVINLDENSRAAFIAKTYGHLTAAIFAFAGVEVFLFKSGLALSIAQFMLGGPWLLFLGAFIVAGWLARGVAHRSVSAPAQYAALAGYVVAEALFLCRYCSSLKTLLRARFPARHW